MQRIREILRAVFEKNDSLINQSNYYYGDDLIGPLSYGGPKSVETYGGTFVTDRLTERHTEMVVF